MKGVNNSYLYSELTEQIIGASFAVQNVLGFGLKEKVYQSALAKEFKNRDIKFREQVQAEIMYNKEVVGKRYFDFLVKDKIIVELKVGDHFNKQIFFQINEYLKVSGLELGLIIMFTAQDVRVRRVVNLIRSVYQHKSVIKCLFHQICISV